MNRYKNNKKAVSPVIATILMVAITVVLAGVLVVYLQTLPSSGGNVETTIGLRADKTAGGDWILSIISGSKIATSVTIQVINPTTGQQVTSLNVAGGVAAPPAGWGPAAGDKGQWNDNNANTKLDAGDTILLYNSATVGHAGVAQNGYKVQFLKGGDTIIGTIASLPS